MKVALVYLGRKGGGAAYSEALARALSSRVELSCVISQQVENIDRWQTIPAKRIEVVDTFHSGLEAVMKSLNPGTFIRIFRLLSAIRPDVVHMPMLHPWSGIILSLAPRNAARVVTLHDPVAHLGDHSRIMDLITQWSLRQADRTIILSKVFREVTIRRGVPENRLSVVPHGPLGDQTVALSATPTLLFFGRVCEYKGLDVLRQAWELVRCRMPDARLVVAGRGDGSELPWPSGVERLDAWIADADVPGLFSRAMATVLPYTDATQSGVIPLSRKLGIPVIATNVGGIPEQVTHERDGLLVEPGDPDGLADACLRILQDAELRERLRTAGLTADPSWEAIADMTIDAYQAAAQRGDSRV